MNLTRLLWLALALALAPGISGCGPDKAPTGAEPAMKGAEPSPGTKGPGPVDRGTEKK